MFLEQGRLLNWVALDKTDSITHGKPRQTDFVALGNMDESRTAALASGIAASIAARSDHPVSKAIAENAVDLLSVDDFTMIRSGSFWIIPPSVSIDNFLVIQTYPISS